MNKAFKVIIEIASLIKKNYLDNIKNINYINNANSLLTNIIKYYNNFISNSHIHNIAERKLNMQNTISARNRDVAINKIQGTNKRANFLLFLTFFALFFCIFVLFFYINDISNEGIGVLTAIIGILGQCVYKAFNFEFGESEIERNENSFFAQEEKKERKDEKNKK